VDQLRQREPALCPASRGAMRPTRGLVARDRAHPVENSGEVEGAGHVPEVGVIGLNVKRSGRPRETSRTTRWGIMAVIREQFA
jgi:hypothetical protein